jgi:hypothetical protein
LSLYQKKIPHLLLIALITFFYAYLTNYLFSIEDATIAFNYIDNIAKFNKITYCNACVPNEGASDFLFIILAGLVRKLGFSAYNSVHCINCIASIVSGCCIIFFTKRHHWIIACLWLFCFFFSSGFLAGLLGYATPFYSALFFLCMFFLYKKNDLLFYVFAVLLFLARPVEGIFISTFVVLNAIINHKIKSTFFYFVMPITIYWLWRTWYFQSWVPLPLLVKSAFPNHSFHFSFELFNYNYSFLAPYFLLLLYCGFILFFKPLTLFKKGHLICVFIAFIVIPFVVYSLVNQDLNKSFRYQWSMYLAMLFISIISINSIRSKYIAIIISVFFLYKNLLQTHPSYSHYRYFGADKNQNYFGEKLKQKTNINTKLATTEAGIIPFKLGCNTIDLWGLNTKKYTFKSPLGKDLQDFDPDIILLNAENDDYNFTLYSNAQSAQKTWKQMTINIYEYIKTSKKYDTIFVDDLISPKTIKKKSIITKFYEYNFPKKEPHSSRFLYAFKRK